MGPKSIKNLIKIRLDFCNDFECLFFRSWIDFGSKQPLQMKGLGVTFSTSLRICEKCDFEQPSYGFAIFFDFRKVDFRPQKLGRSIFDLKRYIFQMFFSKMLSRRTFFDFRSKLGPNSMPNGSPNRWKKQWKSNSIFWWNFDGFSVAPGGGGATLAVTRNLRAPPIDTSPDEPWGSSWRLNLEPRRYN